MSCRGVPPQGWKVRPKQGAWEWDAWIGTTSYRVGVARTKARAEAKAKAALNELKVIVDGP